MGNMLAACPACNMKKANKPLSECVRVWAPDLDSAAANASHLNSAARGCFLNALKIKHDLYHNHGAAPKFLELFDLEIYLEELEDQLKAIKHLLPSDEFEILDEEDIAKGGFGVVYHGIWEKHGNFRKDVAIKFSKGDGSGIIQREHMALKELCVGHQHPNLVAFFGLLRYEWPDDPPLIQYGLVFEWCGPFHLANATVMRKGNLIRLLAQAADALDYMHRRGYLHRDVKPQNILVTKTSSWQDAIAKLADFGTARQILRSAGGGDDSDDEQVYTMGVGTGNYRAPEMHGGYYNTAVDIYSFGKTMKDLRTAGMSPLFRTQSEKLRVWMQIEAACMVFNPSKRPNAEEVRLRLFNLLNGVEHQSGPARLEGPWRAFGPRCNAQSGWPAIAQMNSYGEEFEASGPLVFDGADQDEGDIYVFVCATARTSHDQPKGTTRRGMKYHMTESCFESYIQTTLEIAESFSHTPCKRCCPVEI